MATKFAETVKDTVAQDIGPLVEEILDLSKGFASIKAVCYKEEVDGLHVIFCAPRIQPEEHLCLAEKFLSVADKHPFVYVEFAISSLPPVEHQLSGMKVVQIHTG